MTSYAALERQDHSRAARRSLPRTVNAATPQALCAATLDWLDAKRQEPPKIAALEQRFTALHESLLRNTPQLAADAIQKILAPAA